MPELYLLSKHNSDQKVASLNPAWEKSRWEAERTRWKEQMERRRVHGGSKRRKRRGGEGEEEKMASRCFINRSEMSCVEVQERATVH